MTDISQISSHSQSFSIQTPIDKFESIQIDGLFNELELTLSEVKDMNGLQMDIYQRMMGLIKQTQQKYLQAKAHSIQNHRKCLQHIQILLFQQDYQQALSKIDQYKKIQLTDLSFQDQTLEQDKQKQQPETYTFEQARTIIQSQFADLQIKQRAWLQYALDNSQELDSNLHHVTLEEIETAQLQYFKKQFSINSQYTQPLNSEQAVLGTPQKKNHKSVTYLKSEGKKQKTKSNLKLPNKQAGKSAGKILSSKKKSQQKRTAPKKAIKEQQQNKTSKKVTTAFIA